MDWGEQGNESAQQFGLRTPFEHRSEALLAIPEAQMVALGLLRNDCRTAIKLRSSVRDAENRWIAARRIWNLHAYHVTNVREDGVIPPKMGKNWQLLNTFRSNSQIGDSGDCNPVPK